MAIDLNYKTNTELFNEVAKNYANKIEGVKNTQMRKFYDYVLAYDEKAKKLKTEDEFKSDILPFIKMLNSKVAYAKSRKLVNDTFVNMIKDGITSVKEKKDLSNFKLFFEAVIGFHREVEVQKEDKR